MAHRALRLGVRTLQKIAGRSRVAKLARLATNEVRLDTPNGISCNGEVDVQRVALTDPDPVVLDVGAHFGEWSESLLRQPGRRPQLHAFEPSGPSFRRAQTTLAGRAILHNLALSDQPGTAELHIVHEGAGSNSLVPFTDEARLFGQTESVRVETLNRWTAELAIDRITLLKIDAEGHDLSVIRGARRLTDAQAIDLIQFEYNLRWIDARAFLLDAFEELQPRGYRLGKVTARGIELYPRWHPELETFREGNYLAYLPAWEGRLRTIEWWGP